MKPHNICSMIAQQVPYKLSILWMGQTHREGCGLIVAKGKVSKFGGCQEFDIRIFTNLIFSDVLISSADVEDENEGRPTRATKKSSMLRSAEYLLSSHVTVSTYDKRIAAFA